MNWEMFFFYLNRVNAVLVFGAISLIAIVATWEALSYRNWERSQLDHDEYGVPGLDGKADFDGEEIALADGMVVKYKAEGADDFDTEIEARNVSLTHMNTGKSRLVLPKGSDQIVLRFEQIGRNGEGGDPAIAYMVLAGSEQDHADGRLDLIIGRLSDLEQNVVARQLRFVDSPRMIDDNTMSMIVWPSNDQAEFWLLDLRTLEKTVSRKVEVPLPLKSEGTTDAVGEDAAPVNNFSGEPF